MKSKLAVTALIVAAFTAPTLALAQDRDANRDQPKTFVKDSVITTKIKAKLATERLSSLAKIHVDTEENGKVWLSGSANSQEQIDNGIHYYLAEAELLENGFEEPFVHFDENESPPFLHPAVRDYLGRKRVADASIPVARREGSPCRA